MIIVSVISAHTLSDDLAYSFIISLQAMSFYVGFMSTNNEHGHGTYKSRFWRVHLATKILDKGACTNHVDNWGGGVAQNITILNNSYFVKVSI